MRRFARCSLIVALHVTASTVASAQPSPGAKLAAKALFDAGQELTKAGKYEEACPKLAESQRLDPSMGTEYYLADCYEHIGKISTAWIYYEEVAGLAQAAGQKDREAFARKRADALKARVPKLTIEVAPQGISGGALLVKQDRDEEVTAQQFGMPVPVDPGVHMISAEAKGKKRWSATVEVKEGTSTTVKVPVLEDDGTKGMPSPASVVQSTLPAATTPPAAPPQAVKALSTAPPTVKRRSNVPTYILFGLGDAAAVTGIVLAVKGKMALDEFNSHPTLSQADTVNLFAHGADIALANAILLGGSALLWWRVGARAPSRSPERTVRHVLVAPVITRSGGTLGGGFTF